MGKVCGPPVQAQTAGRKPALEQSKVRSHTYSLPTFHCVGGVTALPKCVNTLPRQGDHTAGEATVSTPSSTHSAQEG